jgi:hypothetical protein
MKVKIAFALLQFYRNFVSLHFFLVSQLTPDFLHYAEHEFCSLETFSIDKAADLQAFSPDNDDEPVQVTSHLPFSLSDVDMKQENDDEDKEQWKAFVSLPDKIVF